MSKTMMINPRQIAVIAAAVAALSACSKPPDPPTAAPKPKTDAIAAANAAAPAATTTEGLHQVGGIAWQKGDVDAAFAAAKAQHKPVFLYWGAVWCPPCNQVKATIFNRQDFIERSRFFVPVYVDGDSASAQRLGDRFKVSGYPTMILFTPDGGEITRLPGEVEVDQYMRVLAMGMNGARPVKETLAAALSSGGGAALSADDWRMLAYYSWDTDEHTLVAAKTLSPTLERLAKACPATQPDTAARLRLRALVAAATAKDVKPREDKAAAADLTHLLADPRLARENFDLLTYYADKVVAYITPPKSAARAKLAADWNAVLERFVADPAISTADRLSAISGRIALARLDAPKGSALPDPLLQTVRDEVARADRETTDPYARQAVISAAADALSDADLMAASDALLEAELKRSHSPYYFMLDIAANAKKRGDKAAALDWEQKAYAAADGPATRLQWGVHYVNALIELAPHDEARIEHAAKSVIGELDPTPDTFYERNRRGLERMGGKLAAWNAQHRHEPAMARIRAQMAAVCAKLPAADPARATCDGVMRSAKGASA
jgi:thiol-disulfide isomerase/thioredoxin